MEGAERVRPEEERARRLFRGLIDNGTASGVSEPRRVELPPPTVPMRVRVACACGGGWRGRQPGDRRRAAPR